jgi:hypothetical protein
MAQLESDISCKFAPRHWLPGRIMRTACRGNSRQSHVFDPQFFPQQGDFLRQPFPLQFPARAYAMSAYLAQGTMGQGNHVDHGRSKAGFPAAWEGKRAMGGADSHGSLGGILWNFGVSIVISLRTHCLCVGARIKKHRSLGFLSRNSEHLWTCGVEYASGRALYERSSNSTCISFFPAKQRFERANFGFSG